MHEAYDWNEERSHLLIEDDEGWPFITGCDCVVGRDHYEGQVAQIVA